MTTSGLFPTTSGDNPINGVCGPMRGIHSDRASLYDDIVEEDAGDIIMSTENATARNALARFAKARADLDEASKSEAPVVEKIDVTSLQIDEAFDVDGDPYNCTGQFLVDALKKKYED